MRYILAALAVLLSVTVSTAAPVSYALQPAKSEVGFIYTLAGNATKGEMPVKRASIAIDLDQLANSSVDVSVDVTRARAGLIFATEALKAPSVLAAKAHPTIRFVSSRIRLNGAGNLSDGAQIDGRITVKGVTRPITLNAALFRQRGTAAGDLSQLSFRLTGQIKRSDFGATGYPELVRDVIQLDIRARVIRKD